MMKRVLLLLALSVPAYSQVYQHVLHQEQPKKSDAVIRAEKDAERCRKILSEIEAPYKKVKVHTPEEAAYHAFMVEQQQAIIESADRALALLLDEDPDDDASGEGFSIMRFTSDMPVEYVNYGGTKPTADEPKDKP